MAHPLLTRSPSSALLQLFWGEGSPTLILTSLLEDLVDEPGFHVNFHLLLK